MDPLPEVGEVEEGFPAGAGGSGAVAGSRRRSDVWASFHESIDDNGKRVVICKCGSRLAFSSSGSTSSMSKHLDSKIHERRMGRDEPSGSGSPSFGSNSAPDQQPAVEADHGAGSKDVVSGCHGRFDYSSVKLKWDYQPMIGLTPSPEYVTLMAEGRLFQAHRDILAAASTRFHELLRTLSAEEYPHPHQIEVRGMAPVMLRCLLRFINEGQVLVPTTWVEGFIKSARDLGIQGSVEVLCQYQF